MAAHSARFSWLEGLRMLRPVARKNPPSQACVEEEEEVEELVWVRWRLLKGDTPFLHAMSGTY